MLGEEPFLVVAVQKKEVKETSSLVTRGEDTKEIVENIQVTTLFVPC